MTKIQKIRAVFLIVACILLVLVFTNYLWWFILIPVIFVYIIVVLFLSLSINRNFFLEAMSNMPGDEIMLTFDDGPHPVYTAKVLDILKEHEVKALFFLIGKNVIGNESIVERILAEGHLIGGHSYNHKWNFGLLGYKKVREEILKTQTLLSNFTGSPIRLFRPPFGVTNPKIALSVKEESLQVIGWNARSYDTAIKDRGVLKERLDSILKPGHIVLLHDPLPQTTEILSSVIKKALENGCKFGVLETTDK